MKIRIVGKEVFIILPPDAILSGTHPAIYLKGPATVNVTDLKAEVEFAEDEPVASARKSREAATMFRHEGGYQPEDGRDGPPPLRPWNPNGTATVPPFADITSTTLPAMSPAVQRQMAFIAQIRAARPDLEVDETKALIGQFICTQHGPPEVSFCDDFAHWKRRG